MTKKSLLFESACILSIIGSSIGFISMTIATFFYSAVAEKIIQITNINATEKLSKIYFAILMGAYCLSLVGALRMYRQKISGLLFYLAAQIIIMFIPVLWIGLNAFSETNAIFTLMFSVIYLSSYRTFTGAGYNVG
jgi:hypothetical protein